MSDWFSDPTHVWIAAAGVGAGAILIAAASTAVFAFVVRTLLRDFLGRQAKILADAVLQSDSFEASLRALSGRIDVQKDRVEVLRTEAVQDRKEVGDLRSKVDRLEGSRFAR